MIKLYKYISSKYVDDVFNKGTFLFRNLTYFKKYECSHRGDPFEGLHRDNPDNDISITILQTGKTVSGDFSFLNEVAFDLIFVFCLSKTLKDELYNEFSCDRCIAINNVDELIRRLNRKLSKMFNIDKKYLLHEEVKYYEPNKHSDIDVHSPYKIPFLKHNKYVDQDEYRFVFAKKDGFKVTKKIVINSKYDFNKEALKGNSKDLPIRIGSIADIAEII